MEFVFDFPNGYELFDLYLLNRLSMRKKPSRRFGMAAARILMAAMGIFLIVDCALGMRGRTSVLSLSGTIATIFLLYGILMVMLALCFYLFNARRSKQVMQQTVGAITITLEEKGFREKTSVSETGVEYKAVKAVYYWRGSWFLYLDDRHAEVLAKRCLTSGDAADVPAFLEQKTGKKIIYVNPKEKTN